MHIFVFGGHQITFNNIVIYVRRLSNLGYFLHKAIRKMTILGIISQLLIML
jgi:hypothetical protein